MEIEPEVSYRGSDHRARKPTLDGTRVHDGLIHHADYGFIGRAVSKGRFVSLAAQKRDYLGNSWELTWTERNWARPGASSSERIAVLKLLDCEAQPFEIRIPGRLSVRAHSRTLR